MALRSRALHFAGSLESACGPWTFDTNPSLEISALQSHDGVSAKEHSLAENPGMRWAGTNEPTKPIMLLHCNWCVGMHARQILNP